MSIPVHRRPFASVILTITPYPDVSPATESYRFATAPIADRDSYRGFARGAVLGGGGFGDVTRAMSSLDGQYEVPTWTLRLADNDGLLRGLLADPQKNLIDEGRWEVTVEIVSEEGRAAELEPMTMLRGVVINATPEPGRTVTLDVRDILGGHMRGFDLDAVIPMWKLFDDFGDNFEFPVGNREQVAPLVYGECSDHGTVDVSGNPAEKGMVPAYYVGKTLIADGFAPTTPPAFPTYLAPPTDLTITVNGTAPTQTVACAVTAFTYFGETTLSDVVIVEDYPILTFADHEPASPSTGNFVDWSWTAPEPEAEVIGYKLYVRDGGGTPRYRLASTVNLTGFAPTTYTDDGGASHYNGSLPGPPGVNTAQIALGEDVSPYAPGSGPMFWDTWIVAAGALPFGIVDFYGANLEDAIGSTTIRVLLNASTANSGLRNVEIIAPGDTRWPYANDWIEKNGRRYTGFFTRGPRSTQALNGNVAYALNIGGYTEEPDATGLMIDQAGYVAQHFLCNWCGLDPDQPTYTSGSVWNDRPRFANGDAKLQTSAFFTFQADTITAMGTELGARCRFVLNVPVTLREWFQWFSWTFYARWKVNHHGQLGLSRLPNSLSATGTRYRDRIEVKRWLTPTFDREVAHAITFIYDFDSELQNYRRVEETIQDAELIAANGGKAKTRARIEMPFTGDPSTARTSAYYFLSLFKRPRRFQPIEIGWRGLAADLADPFLLTHFEGLGETGDTDTQMLVDRHTVSASRDTVILTGLDLSSLELPVIPGTDLWPAASDLEQWPLFDEGRIWGELA